MEKDSPQGISEPKEAAMSYIGIQRIYWPCPNSTIVLLGQHSDAQVRHHLLVTITVFCQQLTTILSAKYSNILMTLSLKKLLQLRGIFPFSVTLRLSPLPLFDWVSAFKLADQYTSNTISVLSYLEA